MSLSFFPTTHDWLVDISTNNHIRIFSYNTTLLLSNINIYQFHNYIKPNDFISNIDIYINKKNQQNNSLAIALSNNTIIIINISTNDIQYTIDSTITNNYHQIKSINYHYNGMYIYIYILRIRIYHDEIVVGHLWRFNIINSILQYINSLKILHC